MDAFNLPSFLLEGKTEEEKSRLLETHRRISEALPTVTDIECLVNIGYLSEDEAEEYKNKPTELPQDKKSLIVNYILYSNIVSLESFSASFYREIQNTIKGYDLKGMSLGNKSIYDILGAEKCGELLYKLCEARVTESKRRVEAFVLSRRRRIREQLLKGLLLRMAHDLTTEPEEGENGEPLDSSPYLRARAEKLGYREKAKSLNDTDRAALKECASCYLDMLEAALINGVGAKRCEFYETLYDEEGYLMEDYHYIDELDEVLFQYKDIYFIMQLLYEHAINELNISRGGSIAVRAAKAINKLAPDDIVLNRVRNSKFKEYAEGITEEATEENLNKAFEKQ